MGSQCVISAVGGSVGKPADTSHVHYDRSVFNWDYYYDKHPELVAKQIDLVAHWGQTGYPVYTVTAMKDSSGNVTASSTEVQPTSTPAAAAGGGGGGAIGLYGLFGMALLMFGFRRKVK